MTHSMVVWYDVVGGGGKICNILVLELISIRGKCLKILNFQRWKTGSDSNWEETR